MVDKLQPHLSKIKAPFGGEKVFKDECAFSFDNPESETGLYVCMNKFIGLDKPYVEPYFRKTGNAVFLHIKRIRKENREKVAKKFENTELRNPPIHTLFRQGTKLALKNYRLYNVDLVSEIFNI